MPQWFQHQRRPPRREAFRRLVALLRSIGRSERMMAISAFQRAHRFSYSVMPLTGSKLLSAPVNSSSDGRRCSGRGPRALNYAVACRRTRYNAVYSGTTGVCPVEALVPADDYNEPTNSNDRVSGDADEVMFGDLVPRRTLPLERRHRRPLRTASRRSPCGRFY